MKPFMKGLAFFLAFLGAGSHAYANCTPSSSGSACLGKSCLEKEIGTTALDSDRKNIIACLADDNGNAVWKGEYGSSSSSYPKSHAIVALGFYQTSANYGSIPMCVFYTDAQGKIYMNYTNYDNVYNHRYGTWLNTNHITAITEIGMGAGLRGGYTGYGSYSCSADSWGAYMVKCYPTSSGGNTCGLQESRAW